MAVNQYTGDSPDSDFKNPAVCRSPILSRELTLLVSASTLSPVGLTS